MNTTDATQQILAQAVEELPELRQPLLPKAAPGRPAGTGNKLTASSLLQELMRSTGRPYAEQLAINYRDAIDSGDKSTIQKYDQLILNKVISDRIDVQVGERDESIAAKQAAFMAALGAAGAHYRESQAITLDSESDSDAK